MPTERILIIEDDPSSREFLCEVLRDAGYELLVAHDGEKGIELFQKTTPDLVICDLKLPKMSGDAVLKKVREMDKNIPLIVLTGFGSIQSAIEAMKMGAFHYLTKPYAPDELLINVKTALETLALKEEVSWRRQEAKQNICDELIGSTPGTVDFIKMVDKVATSDAPTILLEGESGTGKNLVARTIHDKSRRSQYPFVEINCASLPENLIETELFGHERGAFTDAKQAKRGLFEVARGGTLFLDEITEMSLSTQAKLLHAIEQRTFRRVGGVDDIGTDVRIIAATNINLKEAVAQKRFREDIYFRLQLMPIRLLSLRERAQDIPVLVDHFIRKFNITYRKDIRGLTADAEESLKAWPWPGNIRELRNVIERIIILENDLWIDRSHLPSEMQSPAGIVYHSQPTLPEQGLHLTDVERNLIVQALKQAHGNQSRAARLLGITRHTLRYRMEKFGLYTPSEESKNQ